MIRAIILTINLKKGCVSFGLKPSYFTDDDCEMHKVELSSHIHDFVADASHSEMGSERDYDAEVCYMIYFSALYTHTLLDGGYGQQGNLILICASFGISDTFSFDIPGFIVGCVVWMWR